MRDDCDNDNNNQQQDEKIDGVVHDRIFVTYAAVAMRCIVYTVQLYFDHEQSTVANENRG